MANDDLCFLNITELAPLLQARKVSPVEVVEALLERILTWNETLIAYLHVARESALAAARAAEIGFFTCVRPVTAPARLRGSSLPSPRPSIVPSMIAASNSAAPSVVSAAPFPALNSSQSSRTRMAASTASARSASINPRAR